MLLVFRFEYSRTMKPGQLRLKWQFSSGTTSVSMIGADLLAVIALRFGPRNGEERGGKLVLPLTYALLLFSSCKELEMGGQVVFGNAITRSI